MSPAPRISPMNQKLAEFLEKKHKQAQHNEEIDWDQRRDQYISAVDSLYTRIGNILGETGQLQNLAVRRRSKELTENYLGTYRIDDLLLVIGDEQVRFSPAGRNIVGASGRVDLLGDRAEATLILAPDHDWYWVASRQPELKTMRLDETTFTEILRHVMRD